MARPIKNNADYFTHDSDMRNDAKIIALRKKHGTIGYAVWNFMLEELTHSENYEILWDAVTCEVLSADFDISPEELSAIIDYCVKIRLLTIMDGMLFSDRHKERMRVWSDAREAFIEKQRSNGLKGGRPRKDNIPTETQDNPEKPNIIPTETQDNLNISINNKYKDKDINISNEICRVSPDVDSASGNFETFIAEFNRIRGSRFQAIDKVKRQFNARLKEGFTTEQMLQALETAMRDKFHIDTGYKYLTPEFFTRSDKIEKFINVNSPSPEGQEKTHAPQLGADEWMRSDGTRTYGTGSTTVPLDAPPRPSASWWWNDGFKQWNM